MEIYITILKPHRIQILELILFSFGKCKFKLFLIFFYLAPSYVFSYLFKDKYEYPFRKSRNLVHGDHNMPLQFQSNFSFLYCRTQMIPNFERIDILY